MPYKILSMDGGGTWALLEAMAIATLYGPATSGKAILNRFDMVAANSGGSIVLAGLAVDLSPQQIIDLLCDQTKRELIFVKNFLSFTGLERYDTKAKLAGLRHVFGASGDQLLNTVPVTSKLLICTFDYDRQRAQFFRSDSNSPAGSAKSVPQPTLAEAVHASSNAPVKYFDEPAQFATPAFAGLRYWDGAMGGFNNPVMAALTEALAYGVRPGDIQVLSIGTANVCLPMPKPLPAPGSGGQNPLCVQIDGSGIYHDLTKAATTILDDPPDQASFVAHLIINGSTKLSQDPSTPIINGNIVRLNPSIQPVRTPAGWGVPSLLPYAPAGSKVAANYSTDGEAFQALVQLDMDAVEQDDVELIQTLGNAWQADAVPNQSIRANGDLQPLIGHGTYSAAVTQARTLGLA